MRRSARSASVRLCALSSAHHEPAHDERSSIAAKGLTGEGYKATFSGIQKYFCYRFICLAIDGCPKFTALSLAQLARRAGEARRNGWQGALFPWESARSGEKRRRNLPPLTFAPGCGKKWLGAGGTSSGGRYRLGGYSILQTTGDESFIAHEGMALLLERQSSGLAAR